MNRYDEPYVVIAGDFNRRDISRATGNFPLIRTIATPPTRGNAILDIVATNMSDMLVDSGTTAPITTPEGVPSDHRTVFFSFRMPRVPQYRIERYTYHRITPEGSAKFDSWLRPYEETGWRQITTKSTVDQMVDELHKLLGEAMDHCYEKKERVKKTSEPVWMADWIRDLIAKRRELFRSEGRSDRWHSFKKKLWLLSRAESLHTSRR